MSGGRTGHLCGVHFSLRCVCEPGQAQDSPWTLHLTLVPSQDAAFSGGSIYRAPRRTRRSVCRLEILTAAGYKSKLALFEKVEPPENRSTLIEGCLDSSHLPEHPAGAHALVAMPRNHLVSLAPFPNGGTKLLAAAIHTYAVTRRRGIGKKRGQTHHSTDMARFSQPTLMI